MNTLCGDALSTFLGHSRFTRRQALARGGSGLAAGALLASGFPAPAQAATPTPRKRGDDLSGPVDIGDRLLYVESTGSGGPTVVLEAGALGRSDVWSRDLKEPEGVRQMVYQGVATFTHVCTYDRPGTIGEVNEDLEPFGPLFYPSRSDPVPMPRRFQDITDDVSSVLKASGETGPYVLVGHSVGGLTMKYHAMTHPEDVVGLVLVDATEEDVWDEFRNALSADEWAVFEKLTVENPELLAAYPEAEFVWTAPLANDHNVAAVRKARMDSPLKPMPMVVLSHGIPFGQPFPSWSVEKMERIMTDLQIGLARLVPGAKHIVAEKSGHNIHQDQPALVIEAIRMVVDAVRDPSTWTA